MNLFTSGRLWHFKFKILCQQQPAQSRSWRALSQNGASMGWHISWRLKLLLTVTPELAQCINDIHRSESEGS